MGQGIILIPSSMVDSFKANPSELNHAFKCIRAIMQVAHPYMITLNEKWNEYEYYAFSDFLPEGEKGEFIGYYDVTLNTSDQGDVTVKSFDKIIR